MAERNIRVQVEPVENGINVNVNRETFVWNQTYPTREAAVKDSEVGLVRHIRKIKILASMAGAAIGSGVSLYASGLQDDGAILTTLGTALLLAGGYLSAIEYPAAIERKKEIVNEIAQIKSKPLTK